MERRAWRRLVDRYEASDLTQQAFADEHGVAVGTFRSWMYRLRREKRAAHRGSVDFVEVEMLRAVASPSDRGACRIVADDLEIHFTELPPAQWVAEFIGARREAAC